MKFKFLLILSFTLAFFGCEQTIQNSSLKNDLNFENRYKNLGFTLVYNDNLNKI